MEKKKFTKENFFLFHKGGNLGASLRLAKQSQSNIAKDVDVVGTILFGSDSLNFGKVILISLAFINILLELDAIPIILILNLLANFNKFVSSFVFPELEIIIKISFFSI